MKNTKHMQRGFTLLELVVVIAVVGVLLVVAMPKLLGTSTDARQAATNKVAGTLSAALAQNYAIRAADNSKGVVMRSCSVAGNALQGGTPTGYTIVATSGVAASAAIPISTLSAGAVSSTTCTVQADTTPSVSATFLLYSID